MSERPAAPPSRRMTKQQASLCAVLVTVLVLGTSIAAWAALCPTGVIPLKHTGGGPCQCTNIAQQWGTGDCYCAGEYICVEGPQDYLMRAGGCHDPVDKTEDCHSQRYPWTQYFYARGDCYVDPLQCMTYGNCVQTGSLPQSANTGWNSGPCPGY